MTYIERIIETQNRIDEHHKLAKKTFFLTGPQTPAAQKRVAERAKRNPLMQEVEFLTEEQYPKYLEFGSEMFADLRPVGPAEIAAVQTIVTLMWQCDRIDEMEACVYHAFFITCEEELGRSMTPDEYTRAQTIAWIRDCNGPNLFDKLSRLRHKLLNEQLDESEKLLRRQSLRRSAGEDTFQFGECTGWLWYEEMLFLYSQLEEAHAAAMPRLAA